MAEFASNCMLGVAESLNAKKNQLQFLDLFQLMLYWMQTVHYPGLPASLEYKQLDSSEKIKPTLNSIPLKFTT